MAEKLDREPRFERDSMYCIPLWVGLLFSGIYVLWLPLVDPVISEQLEDRLAVAMIIGATLCLTGAFIKDRITAYKLEFVGLAIIFVVLGFLANHVDRTLIEQWTLMGGMGGLIQVGNVRMMVQIGREIHDHNKKKVAV